MNNQTNFQTNFITIGNKNIQPNFISLIEILAVMIMSYVTPGIIALNKFSPYSIYQDSDKINSLPDNWQVILNKNIFIDNILKKYTTDNILKMIYHICWGDLHTTKTIISNINESIKECLKDTFGISNLIRNSYSLFDIDDNYAAERIRRYFCLDDKSELENDSVYNYLMSYRDESSVNILIILKLLGEIVLKYNSVFNYVSKYANVYIHDLNF